MNEPLRKLERALYRTVVDGGVWDMVLGAWLLAIGGTIAAGVPPVAHVVGGATFPIGYMFAQRTARRAGHVQFNAERTRRLRRARVVAPVTAIALLASLVLAGPLLPDLVKAGILLAAPLSIAAYLFDIPRFHVYAILILLAVAGVLVRGLRGELALIVAGTTILICGLVVLTRFLHKYPNIADTSHG